nr:hypothetical protein [Candidatus Sigynarchaeota archaeon]
MAEEKSIFCTNRQDGICPQVCIDKVRAELGQGVKTKCPLAGELVPYVGPGPVLPSTAPARSHQAEQLVATIKEHFEWCKGTPVNPETEQEEKDLLRMVDNLDKAGQVEVIYAKDPIEIKLWDGRTVEIGKRVVQIRKGGNIVAVYSRG